MGCLTPTDPKGYSCPSAIHAAEAVRLSRLGRSVNKFSQLGRSEKACARGRHLALGKQNGHGPCEPGRGLDRSSSVDWSRRRIARARDMGKQGCAVLVVSARAACGVSAADGETSARCEISATALTLRLTGNETKSAAVARPEERKFLDFSISRTTRAERRICQGTRRPSGPA